MACLHARDARCAIRTLSRSRFKAQSGPQSAFRPLDGSTDLTEVCGPTGAICDLLNRHVRYESFCLSLRCNEIARRKCPLPFAMDVIGWTHPWCVSSRSRGGYRIPSLPLPCAHSPGEGGEPFIPRSPKVKVFPPAKILRSTPATWFTLRSSLPTAPYDIQFCIVAYREIPLDYKPGGSAERTCPGVLSRFETPLLPYSRFCGKILKSTTICCGLFCHTYNI